MSDLLVRFLIGGIVVSSFAVISDILTPKSFAGLFGAAPSVALATLGLTVVKQTSSYAASEARSMIAGAVAFFVYASWVSWFLMRHRRKSVMVTILSLPLWAAVALGLWVLCLR